MTNGELIALAVSGLVSVAVSALTGIAMVRRLTLALEGHYEFKGDSLTKRSRLAGFGIFAIWAIVVAVAWSFFIDWLWFQDFGFAVEALLVRLEIILTILAELGDD